MSDPAWLAKAIEASIERLGRGPLDVYLLHGVDPRFGADQGQRYGHRQQERAARR